MTRTHNTRRKSSPRARCPAIFYWNYPPLFFFVAVVLASAPYLAAFLGLVIATGAGLRRHHRRYCAPMGSRPGRLRLAVILLTAFGGQNGIPERGTFGRCSSRSPGTADHQRHSAWPDDLQAAIPESWFRSR